jgi:zinc protease
MRGLRQVLFVLVVGCGASPPREVSPTLPAEVVQPEPAPATGEGPRSPEADPWAGRADLVASPPLSPPSPVNLPTLQRFTLKNGLQVLVVENHELPVVSLHLAVHAGSADETRARRGLASFAAQMLTRGTPRHTADAIAEAVDFVGGSLEASSDFEETHVSCGVLTKDLETCLTLLPEVVLSPLFPDQEMGEIRDRFLSELREQRDSARALANEHFENALWGDEHVRGWPMTEDTIGAISQKDLALWHATYFRPQNALLAVAGDVNAKGLRARLEKAFALWKQGPVPPRNAYRGPPWQGVQVRLVDKPDQTQSQIVLGHLGVAHGDADYFPTMLMNYTLGGGAFSSRLMKVVRSEGGKTYGASSSFERWKTRGTFEATTFTRTAETVPTLKLVLSELAKMKAEGPTEVELKDAQTNLAGGYPLAFETASDVASAVLSAELHGLGEDYVRQFPVRIAKVTRAEAVAAAREHLEPERVVIVIVGKAAEVGPALREAGLGFEQVDYLDPISKKDREKKPTQLDPASEAAARALLAQALEAKGGAVKLRAIRDLTFLGKVKLMAGAQELEGAYQRYLLPQARLRMNLDLQSLGRKISVVVTEDGAWQAQGTDVVELPGELVNAARATLWRDRDLVLLSAQEAKIVAYGKQALGEVEAFAITIERVDGSWQTRLFFDAKTRLLVGMEYQEDGKHMREDFSDYKTIDGVAFALRQRAAGPQGTPGMDITLTEVKVNAGVPQGTWDKPKAE